MMAEPSFVTGTPSPPPLVLVADDDADNRELYRYCLTLSGFAVEEVATGCEAVRMAKELLPAVVVTDIALPVIDGFVVCEAIKRDTQTAKIAVIAVTGYGDRASRDRGKQAGFDAFLVKPVVPEDLIAEIRKWLVGASSGTAASAGGQGSGVNRAANLPAKSRRLVSGSTRAALRSARRRTA